MNSPDSNLKHMYQAYKCDFTRSEMSHAHMCTIELKFITVCMLHLELTLLKAYSKRKPCRKIIDDSEKLDDNILKNHNFFKDHIVTLLQQQIFFFESSIHKLNKTSQLYLLNR